MQSLLRVTVALPLCIIVFGKVFADERGGCDRACLDAFARMYLQSLVANDSGLVPIAHDARFTEDGVDYQPGEGFWQQATRLRKHRLNILDERWSTAVGLAVMEAGDDMTLLAYRLKVDGHRLSEIETLVVRPNPESGLVDRDNLEVPAEAFHMDIPKAQRASRDELIRVSQYYPDGLKAGSFIEVDAPIAEGARRLENGMVLAGPDCTFNENCLDMKTQPSPERPTLRQRLLAVDEKQGITFYWLAWEQESGATLIVWEAFKVYDGMIHAVEAFLKPGDPDIDSGW